MKQESEFQILRCKLIITFSDMTVSLTIFNSFTRPVILQRICRAVKPCKKKNRGRGQILIPSGLHLYDIVVFAVREELLGV